MGSRKIPEINAGSMADIAFLLLVFFLVTTTIQTDAGVSTVLPPYIPENVKAEFEVNKRNVCAIKINAANSILVRGSKMDIPQIREFTYNFMTNNGKDPEKADSPKTAVISMQNDNGTSYDVYLEVYNEVKAACNQLRNELSKEKFGFTYDKLTREQQKQIRELAPCIISEAEPSKQGDKDKKK